MPLKTSPPAEDFTLPRVSSGGVRVLAGALSVQIAISAVAAAFPTLTPFLIADTGLTLTQIGTLTFGIYFTTMIAGLPAGWASDTIGDRLVLVGGAGITFLMAALLSSGWLTVAWFFLPLAGVGAMVATATPVGARAVVNAFPPSRRGLALGIRQTGIPLGGALLP